MTMSMNAPTPEEALAELKSKVEWWRKVTPRPLWLPPIASLAGHPQLDTALEAVRAITQEWWQKDRNEAVRTFEYPVIGVLAHTPIPPERKGEVIEACMSFMAVCDDVLAGKIARELSGLPESWEKFGLENAARDVLRDIEREFPEEN
jgi:hypothetical protein